MPPSAGCVLAYFVRAQVLDQFRPARVGRMSPGGCELRPGHFLGKTFRRRGESRPLGLIDRLPLSAVGRGTMRAHVAPVRLFYCDRSGPWRKGTMQGFHLARTRRLRRLEPDFGFKLDSSSSACRAIPPFTCPAFFLSAASRSWSSYHPTARAAFWSSVKSFVGVASSGSWGQMFRLPSRRRAGSVIRAKDRPSQNEMNRP
jgi:hypothetical protein